MDSIADVAARARYVRVRNTLLTGTARQQKMAKGRLVVNVDIRLKDAGPEDHTPEENRVVCELKTIVLGIPATAPDNQKDEENAAFRLEINQVALISWQDEVPDFMKESQDLAALVARPLYMAAVPELRGLGNSLGLSSINLNSDLLKVIADSEPDAKPEAAAQAVDEAKVRAPAKRSPKSPTKRTVKS